MADKVLADVQIQLTKGLTLTVIKQLLDDLKMDKVLNEEEAETILESNAARADKARDLIHSVEKKGCVASEIMIAKLKVRDQHLYNELKLGRPLLPACEEPAPEALAHQPITVSDDDSNEVYTMDSIPRGFCVIINNEEFKNEKRKGSDKDAAALEKVFKILGFDVQIYTNQEAEAMKKLLLDFSKKEHGDCFVCCVLSHGEKEGVLGIDEELCPMKDILSPFDGINCSSLAGKPKVFFIQACRGENMEANVVVSEDNVVEVDGLGLTIGGPKNTYSISQYSDFLVSMSTVDDHVSYRNEGGSWFIQALCKQLEDGSQRGDDILTILTRVNNEVSRKVGEVEVQQSRCCCFSFVTTHVAKMTPEPCYTLRKKLIFRIA
ncbi:caspase-8-like isoform X2 [Pygocentrus nattereri]|uniref:Caspase-8 n=1 Tax=Pygocentrus nattereri TaxID=42514 RepID=A0AAR2M1U6_PYGNA|nr:caspase-8-like isoform X2 [Pygocentrus nattereri]